MVVRASFYGSFYWALPFLLIIYLFFVFFGRKLMVKSHNTRSLTIATMILIYFIWLCPFAILMGSNIDGVIQRAWQHVLPLLFYFVAFSQITNREKINQTFKTIAFASFLVSLFFLIEWVRVNIYGYSNFPYALKMHELGWIQGLYVSKGGSTMFDSINTTLRIGGPLMTMQNTSLFILFGVIYYSSDLLFFNNKKKLIQLVICLAASIIAFARTNLIMFIIAHLISFHYFKIKKRDSAFFKIILVLAFTVTIFTFIKPEFLIILSKFYNLGTLLNIYEGPLVPVFEEFVEYYHFLMATPIKIFLGQGFGYWTSNKDFFFSADFGIASFHSMIGSIGSLLIIIFLIQLIKDTIKRRLYIKNDITIKRWYYVAYTFAITAIFSSVHYIPIFHHGNYLAFFTMIAIISILNISNFSSNGHGFLMDIK
jgi:hypothetical protein